MRGQEPFDALAAAAELEASLAEAGREGEHPPDRYVEILEEEIASLNVVVERQEAALRESRASAAKALEDVERAKVRLQRDEERRSGKRIHELLGRFLEVLDDADRALGAVRQLETRPEVVAGLELLGRRLETALQAEGVTRQSALGARFDPALHEAGGTQPVNEPERDGVVLAVIREGYRLGENVLRPARVVVGKRPAG